MTRLNKEFKIDLCKNICLKYGSTNKVCPQVIYIFGKMWLCPTYDGDFETPINAIYNNFKKKLSKELSNSIVFDKKHILDFDINPDNLEKNKKKFCSISLFIKQNPEKIIDLKNLKKIIYYDFGHLFNELENNLIENDFEISKRK